MHQNLDFYDLGVNNPSDIYLANQFPSYYLNMISDLKVDISSKAMTEVNQIAGILGFRRIYWCLLGGDLT